VKSVGKPDAGNPHVRFDERGRETGRLAKPQATAPFLDSTIPVIPCLKSESVKKGLAPITALGDVMWEAGNDEAGDARLGSDLENCGATVKYWQMIGDR
jgi:hypothetical protein